MFNWFLNCSHFSFQIALLFFFQIYYLNTHLWTHWYFFTLPLLDDGWVIVLTLPKAYQTQGIEKYSMSTLTLSRE